MKIKTISAGKDHQHGSQPEWVSRVHIIQIGSEQEGDDGADAAHKVDDAVGLGAVLRGVISGIKRNDRRPPQRHAQQQRAGAGDEQRQDGLQWESDRKPALPAVRQPK